MSSLINSFIMFGITLTNKENGEQMFFPRATIEKHEEYFTFGEPYYKGNYYVGGNESQLLYADDEFIGEIFVDIDGCLYVMNKGIPWMISVDDKMLLEKATSYSGNILSDIGFYSQEEQKYIEKEDWMQLLE